MHHRLLIVFLLLPLLWTACRRPSSAMWDETSSDSFDSLCQTLFPAEEPGAEVLVMLEDSIVYDRCYGLADLPSGRPVDSLTAFNIASCSKQFTAVAVLQLVEGGLVSLDASVHTYFPEFESAIWDSVQIRHLLSHSSGVPDARGYLSREEKIAGTDSLATAYLRTLDYLHFAPGTAYEYINPTFTLCGALIERVSGMPFAEYMRRHVFLPAGMSHTCYFEPTYQDTIAHIAHGYEYADVTNMPEERTASADSEQVHDWYEYDFGEETFFATRPDGGIYTTARQLVAWERALRKCLRGESGAILRADLLKEAMTPHTTVSGSKWSDYQNRPGTSYGYGWFIEPEKNVIYHTGDNGGFKILLARYPDCDGLLVVLSARADWDRYALKTTFEEICTKKYILK